MKEAILYDAPLVAIGLIVYNGENYISTAIDSLLSQTFKEFDLIISDNASTDATEKICRQYAAKDKRIKYIRQDENIGAYNNFRFVREKGANSKYFMWAAHDDFWAENWLEVLIDEFKPTDLAVRGNAVIVNESGDILSTCSVTSFKKNQILKVFFDDEKNCRAFYWYALFNNYLLKKVNLNLLDDTFGADVFSVTHLVQFGDLRVTEKTSQYYRQHEGNATTKFKKDWFGLRRYIYHLLPLNIYIYSIRTVKFRYKLLILIMIPFKYIRTQYSILLKLLHLIFTGTKY